jgi:hypothetical protein
MMVRSDNVKAQVSHNIGPKHSYFALLQWLNPLLTFHLTIF